MVWFANKTVSKLPLLKGHNIQLLQKENSYAMTAYVLLIAVYRFGVVFYSSNDLLTVLIYLLA